jgi:hypothetical protein
MKHCFYTYFDSNFLCRGLALYQSLSSFTKDFTLYILCLDNKCFETVANLALPNIIAISLKQLEQYDEALAKVKASRSKIEYYFSCTASFGCYLFAHFPIQFLTYLDGDTYFFASPIEFLKEIQPYSIAIAPHRFPAAKKHNEKYGIYNVGWVSFKRDEEGLACIRQWREDCIAWCYNRLEDDKYGDQKYLDKWPALYRNVKIIDHAGINTAPWNLENYKVSYKAGQIFLNEYPLIFYHFHNLYRLNGNIFKLGLAEYAVDINQTIKQQIYGQYIKTVKNLYKELNLSGTPKHGILSKDFSWRRFKPWQDLLWSC